MGQKKAPEEIQRMDHEEILQVYRGKQLGLLWRGRGSGILSRGDRTRANQTTRQSQGRSKPLRPGMGTLLRKTPGRSHGEHPERKTMALSPLERAKRTLPNLPTENHQNHRMAQPSHPLEVKRWIKHSRKPSAPSSQLSSTSSQPRRICSETASCQGRLKHLHSFTPPFPH